MKTELTLEHFTLNFSDERTFKIPCIELKKDPSLTEVLQFIGTQNITVNIDGKNIHVSQLKTKSVEVADGMLIITVAAHNESPSDLIKRLMTSYNDREIFNALDKQYKIANLTSTKNNIITLIGSLALLVLHKFNPNVTYTPNKEYLEISKLVDVEIKRSVDIECGKTTVGELIIKLQAAFPFTPLSHMIIEDISRNKKDCKISARLIQPVKETYDERIAYLVESQEHHTVLFNNAYVISDKYQGMELDNNGYGLDDNMRKHHFEITRRLLNIFFEMYY